LIKPIIKIRVAQLVRLLGEIGLGRLLFLFILLAILMYLAYKWLADPTRFLPLAIFSGIALLLIHLGRKDKRFLSLYARRPYRVFASEYMVLVLPFMVIGALHGHLQEMLCLPGIALVVPLLFLRKEFQVGIPAIKFLLNPFRASGHYALNIRVPIRHPLAFEWIAGLRQTFIIFVLAYALFLGFSFKPTVGVVGMLVLSVIVTNFYNHGEAREYIECFANSPKAFMAKKLLLNSKYMFLAILPLALVSVAFHPDTWYLVLGAMVLALLVQAIAIIFKYGLFTENADLSRNGMIVFFNVFCTLVPFFWPLPIIMGTRYYFKALRNLKPYFS
jgi:hypothetical protein